MGTLLDMVFGSSGSRVDRINKATADAEAGVKVTNPTLGQPGGEEAKAGTVDESAALKRKKKRKRQLASRKTGSSLSRDAVRSIT
jgi:hypothetical protein